MGRIHRRPEERAQTELINRNPSEEQGRQANNVNYAPSAPPMADTGNKNEVNSPPKSVVLYHMQVTRIYIDSHYVALYQNTPGIVYKTNSFNG